MPTGRDAVRFRRKIGSHGRAVKMTRDLGRLGCRRRSHRAPSAFGTETISSLNDLLSGASPDARHGMNPLSAADVFLTVAIMSVAFLTEIALFILIGMI
jgi:hypothetical protein